MSDPATLAYLNQPEMQTFDQPSTITPPDISQFRARLCIMNKWPNFQGYGFNLHADKTVDNSDQFVGRVDENSPSAVAGLLSGDRIVEVNGTNVGILILILDIYIPYIFCLFPSIHITLEYSNSLSLLPRITTTQASCPANQRI